MVCLSHLVQVTCIEVQKVIKLHWPNRSHFDSGRIVKAKWRVAASTLRVKEDLCGADEG